MNRFYYSQKQKELQEDMARAGVGWGNGSAFNLIPVFVKVNEEWAEYTEWKISGKDSNYDDAILVAEMGGTPEIYRAEPPK